MVRKTAVQSAKVHLGAALLAIILGLTGCSEFASITAHPTAIDLLVGDTLTVTLSGKRSDGTDAYIPASSQTFTSQNPAVASVGQFTGVVTGVSEGRTTIIVTDTVYGLTTEISVLVAKRKFDLNVEVRGHTSSLILANKNTMLLRVDGLTDPEIATFSLVNGSIYKITIAKQPEGQTCTVTGGSSGSNNGTGTINGAHDNSVIVTCVNNTWTISGTASGLGAGKSFVLSDGADTILVSANGGFVFPKVQNGTHPITVVEQPSGQTCTPSPSNVAIAGANFTTLAVTCVDNIWTISGTASGLGAGKSFVLSDGADTILVSANAGFVFPKVQNGSYPIIVNEQPEGQTCTPSVASITINGADDATLVVTCVDNWWTISGVVTGLALNDKVVLSNGPDVVTVTGDGTSSDALIFPLVWNGYYTISVIEQPAGKTCTVTSANPLTIADADDATVVVDCI